MIERTASDSERLAPVMARERVLPADAQAALRERAVVAERGRLAGPAAAELLPRGALVDRSRTVPSSSGAREPVAADRFRISERGSAGVVSRERAPAAGGVQPPTRQTGPGDGTRIVTRPAAEDSWRTRGNARQREVPPSELSEARPSIAPPPGRPSAPARSDSWRSRSDLPPARRVIEGAVPERRAPESRNESLPRGSEPPPDRELRPREVPGGRTALSRSASRTGAGCRASAASCRTRPRAFGPAAARRGPARIASRTAPRPLHTPKGDALADPVPGLGSPHSSFPPRPPARPFCDRGFSAEGHAPLQCPASHESESDESRGKRPVRLLLHRGGRVPVPSSLVVPAHRDCLPPASFEASSPGSDSFTWLPAGAT